MDARAGLSPTTRNNRAKVGWWVCTKQLSLFFSSLGEAASEVDVLFERVRTGKRGPACSVSRTPPTSYEYQIACV